MQDKAESSGGGTQSGASVNTVELKQLIANKADKSDLHTLENQKSNKTDTEQSMKCADIMHKQITHIIVLFIEIIKYQ